MAATVDDLRNKCRTCRYLATNESNSLSGYCWQSDSTVQLVDFRPFLDTLDPGCADILEGGEPAWMPLTVLEHYFREDDDDR